jgi:hypothetical protein
MRYEKKKKKKNVVVMMMVRTYDDDDEEEECSKHGRSKKRCRKTGWRTVVHSSFSATTCQ